MEIKPGHQAFDILSSERIFRPDKIVAIPGCDSFPERQCEKPTLKRFKRKTKIGHSNTLSVHGGTASLFQGLGALRRRR